MAQINLSTEKKLMDLKNRLVVAKGEGEGVGLTGNLGLVDADFCLWNGLAMRSCCVAMGSIYSHLWWSMIMWEKECIYLCVTGSSSCTVENWQNNVNQLWWEKKIFKKKSGVPIVAQWKSLASLSGLGIRHCHELWCRPQTWLRSWVAVAVVEAGRCSSDATPSPGTSI